MDMSSALARISDSLEGTIPLDVESLTEGFSVLSEHHAHGVFD